MNATIRAQFNHRTTILSVQITPRLTWREREILATLAGHEWVSEPKLARVSLKFAELVNRLRLKGVPIQSLAPLTGGKLYRLAPKSWLPSPPPAANLPKAGFVLGPMRPRRTA